MPSRAQSKQRRMLNHTTRLADGTLIPKLRMSVPASFCGLCGHIIRGDKEPTIRDGVRVRLCDTCEKKV